MKRFEKYYKYIVWFIFCVAVIAVYKTFDNLSEVAGHIGAVLGALKPFVAAFVIAYLINMPAVRIQKRLENSKKEFLKNHAKGLSILTVYLIALLVVIFILWMLIPALYRNLLDLYNNAPAYIQSITDYIEKLPFAQRLNLRNFDITGEIAKFFGSLDISQLGKYAQGVFSVTSGVFSSFVAIIASIYMLIDKQRLQNLCVRILRGFFKAETVSSITEHARRINLIFTNYIYARLSCSIIMGVICSIILTIMRVKYALILGIFIGAMDMIPYFGSIISCVVAILVTLITGGFWKGLWTAVVLLVMQQIDGNVLGPKIMGDSLEIRPFWIIFAVSVGGTLFGFVGMLISVPVIAIIRAIFLDYMESRERRAGIAAAGEESEADAE